MNCKVRTIFKGNISLHHCVCSSGNRSCFHTPAKLNQRVCRFGDILVMVGSGNRKGEAFFGCSIEWAFSAPLFMSKFLFKA